MTVAIMYSWRDGEEGGPLFGETEDPFLYMFVVPHHPLHCPKRVHHEGSVGGPNPRHSTICRRQLDERFRVAEIGRIVQPAPSFRFRYGIVMSDRWARQG